MTEISLYQKPSMTPVVGNESDGETTRVLGTVAFSDVDTYIVALEWFAPVTLPAFADLALWTLTGDDPNSSTGSRTDLMTFSVGSMVGGDWNRLTLPVARLWPAGKPRQAQVHTDGHYTYTSPGTFPFSSADGSLHAYSAVDGGNGRWSNGAGSASLAQNQHPGGSGYNFWVNFITDVDGNIVTGTIGQVVETGVVQPISKAKSVTIGLVNGPETVFGILKAKSRTLNQVTESGIVLPPSFSKAKSISQVTEAGIVFPPSFAKSKTLNQVTEIGEVLSLRQVVSATIGQVVETGTVNPVTKAKSKTIGQITETGSVFPISKAKSRTIGQVIEAGSVFQVTNGTTISGTIGQVVELSSVGRLGIAPDVDTQIFITPGYTVINL